MTCHNCHKYGHLDNYCRERHISKTLFLDRKGKKKTIDKQEVGKDFDRVWGKKSGDVEATKPVEVKCSLFSDETSKSSSDNSSLNGHILKGNDKFFSYKKCKFTYHDKIKSKC